MAIEYNKTNWVNDQTKLNADNMNHIEDGIEAATNAVNDSVTNITAGLYIAVEKNGQTYLVKVDDTALAKNFIKIDNFGNSIIPRMSNGLTKWTSATSDILANSIVMRDPNGSSTFNDITLNGSIYNTSGASATIQQILNAVKFTELYLPYDSSKESGTLTEAQFTNLTTYPNMQISYNKQLYYRMDPINAPDGTLNYIHIDSVQDGNGGYKATGKCFSITVSTRAWQVVDLDFSGRKIYQHKILIEIDKSAANNAWYISFVLTTSSSTQITADTLYKYLPQSDYPAIDGLPIDCYRATVESPEGYGLGRMSATLPLGEGLELQYYFWLAQGTTYEVTDSTVSPFTNFIDTVTEV